MIATPNIVNQIKRHFCASGSILLPLAQKWCLVAALVATCLPCIISHTVFADAVTLSVPSYPLTAYVFPEISGSASRPVDATIIVSGEGNWGYTLSMSSESESNALTSGKNILPSIKAEKDTIRDFENNTWGYRITGGNIKDTKFRPGPTKNTPIEIDKTEGAINETEYLVTLGAVVDNTQPAGTYAGRFIIMATANVVHYSLSYFANADGAGDGDVQGIPSNTQSGETTEREITLKLASEPPTWEGYIFKGWCDIQPTNSTAPCTGQVYEAGTSITLALQGSDSANTKRLWATWEQDIQTMQDFVCLSSAKEGDTITLKDSRDGNTYRVRKLKDGNCWMIDNLRLGDDNLTERTLTSANTDLNGSPSTFMLETSVETFSNSVSSAPPQINTDSVDTEISGAGGKKQKVGVYYNWYAATAGTGTYNTPLGTDAPSSICPKGWKLPRGDSNGDFKTLIDYYSGADTASSKSLIEDEDGPEFLLSGLYAESWGGNQGWGGNYWSRTGRDPGWAYDLSINSSSVRPSDDSYKYYGYSVRCVAYTPPSMQKIGEWGGGVEKGETVTAIDERDGNTYRVRRLEDGKLWMVDNLKIAGKTLTPADSDVSTDFPLPESDKNGFSDYDVANVYIATNSGSEKEEYGGYYTWYAATAGTGTSSMNRDEEATGSICPKGWKLPTGDSSGDFQTLYDKYETSDLMRETDSNSGPEFLLSGRYVMGAAVYQDSYGFYWSRTANGTNYSNYLYIDSSSVGPTYGSDNYHGYSVRCVADELSMQTVGEWGGGVEKGETVTAVDMRDGNTYRVRRLEDGKLWMVDNLKIAGKTLTPADSDVSTDFPLPESDENGFSDYDVANVYIANDPWWDEKEEWGGYYTWYAATAGTGTSSMNRDEEATSSICPKGWKLPKGGSGGDFETLYNHYKSLDLMLAEDGPNFLLSGDHSYGNPENFDYLSYYWSRTAYSSASAYILFLIDRSSSSVDPTDYNYKYYGCSVRCVAEL